MVAKIVRNLKVSNLIDLFLLIILFPIAMLAKLKYKDVWLVSEGINGARDNGYHFFKYVRENFPNKNIYYVIEKDSSDYHKINKLGNCINHRSLKHYIFSLLCDKRISTAIGAGLPNRSVGKLLECLGMIRSKKIYLKHGIVKDFTESLLYKNTKLDLFICGAKPEYDFVSKEFGYPIENVKYTGLCRFDGLHDIPSNSNKILIMPTWRRWISKTSRDDFLKSEFYIRYQELLNHPKLLSFLENNNIQLIFYPHIVLQNFIAEFHSSSEMVIIASNNEYDVQQLLRESSLLITDYSSVFFDFAYMRKPIIYYQFDSMKYRQFHYKEGYFKYENGFGPLCKKVDEVIDFIEYYCETNYVVSKKYYERILNFFPLYDRNNCERVYKEILKLQ